MKTRTGQLYNDRLFATTFVPSTDPMAMMKQISDATTKLTDLVGGFIRVVEADLLAQTGTVILLTYMVPFSEICDGQLNIQTAVDMSTWPEGVMFGPKVWEFLASRGVEVED